MSLSGIENAQDLKKVLDAIYNNSNIYDTYSSLKLYYNEIQRTSTIFKVKDDGTESVVAILSLEGISAESKNYLARIIKSSVVTEDETRVYDVAIGAYVGIDQLMKNICTSLGVALSDSFADDNPQIYSELRGIIEKYYGSVLENNTPYMLKKYVSLDTGLESYKTFIPLNIIIEFAIYLNSLGIFANDINYNIAQPLLFDGLKFSDSNDFMSASEFKKYVRNLIDSNFWFGDDSADSIEIRRCAHKAFDTLYDLYKDDIDDSNSFLVCEISSSGSVGNVSSHCTIYTVPKSSICTIQGNFISIQSLSLKRCGNRGLKVNITEYGVTRKLESRYNSSSGDITSNKVVTELESDTYPFSYSIIPLSDGNHDNNSVCSLKTKGLFDFTEYVFGPFVPNNGSTLNTFELELNSKYRYLPKFSNFIVKSAFGHNEFNDLVSNYNISLNNDNLYFASIAYDNYNVTKLTMYEIENCNSFTYSNISKLIDEMTYVASVSKYGHPELSTSESKFNIVIGGELTYIAPAYANTYYGYWFTGNRIRRFYPYYPSSNPQYIPGLVFDSELKINKYVYSRDNSESEPIFEKSSYTSSEFIFFIDKPGDIDWLITISNLGEIISKDSETIPGMSILPNSKVPKDVIDSSTFYAKYPDWIRYAITNPSIVSGVVDGTNTGTWVSCSISKSVTTQSDAQNALIMLDDIKDIIKDMDKAIDDDDGEDDPIDPEKDPDIDPNNDPDHKNKGDTPTIEDIDNLPNVLGAGAIKQYVLTSQQLNNLMSNLNSDSIWVALSKFISNPMNFIISLQAGYLYQHVGATSGAYIRFGPYTFENCQGTLLNSNFCDINLGTVNLEPYFNNYTDITETSVSLYLPYVGYVDLDVSKFINGLIKIHARIDTLTGSIIYYIYSIRDGHEQLLNTFDGNCQMQIPINSSDFSRMYASLFGTAVASTSGFVSSAVSTPKSRERLEHTIKFNKLLREIQMEKELNNWDGKS